jgi:hypothetical protein
VTPAGTDVFDTSMTLERPAKKKKRRSATTFSPGGLWQVTGTKLKIHGPASKLEEGRSGFFSFIFFPISTRFSSDLRHIHSPNFTPPRAYEQHHITP